MWSMGIINYVGHGHYQLCGPWGIINYVGHGHYQLCGPWALSIMWAMGIINYVGHGHYQLPKVSVKSALCSRLLGTNVLNQSN